MHHYPPTQTKYINQTLTVGRGHEVEAEEAVREEQLRLLVHRRRVPEFCYVVGVFGE